MIVVPEASIDICVLGRFVLRGPSEIALTNRKLIGLLAYLACTASVPQPRHKLMALLWGSHFDTQARQNLRQALSGLRRIIGDMLVTSGDTVSLRPGAVSCDVADFELLVREGSPESLDAAVGLYRGQLLADSAITEEVWSEWLDGERQRLEDMALDAMIRLGEQRLAMGRSEQALAVAKRAVAISALREDAHRLVIRASSASGRKAEALQHYDALAALLKRELDVEPDEATVELIKEIRASSGSHARTAAPTATPSTKDPPHRRPRWTQEHPRAILAVTQAAPGHDPDDGLLRDAGQRLAELCKGRVVDRAGGTMLLDFPDPRSAIHAGHAAQHPHLSIAAHTSETRAVAKDTARQLMMLARPGQMVVTVDVCDVLTDGLDAHIEDLGEHDISGSGTFVRAYRLGLPGPVRAQARPAAQTTVLPGIAVVPFGTRGKNGDQGAIGQLLADEIIAGLCRAKDLAVISRMSTRAFSGRDVRLADIAAQLRADYVLWGSCEADGAHVTVRPELAEAHSEQVIWAGEFRAPVSAVGQGCVDITEQIVAETSAAILNYELKRVQTQPLETLENYSILTAAINLVHRTSPASFSYAHELLQLLIDRLPRHPLPQAWLAQWHVMKVSQGWAEDVAAEQQLALDCAKKANDMDPTCSIAIAMDGWVHTHLLKRFDIAAERFEQAVEVNPSDAMAWLLKGTMHAFKGEGKAAIVGAQRALRLSPLDPRRSYYDCLAATAFLSANEYGHAIELARRSLRVNRLHSSTLRALTIAQVLSGHVEDARRTVPELLRVEPRLTVKNYLGRHPAASFPVGKTWAEALRVAGVPE